MVIFEKRLVLGLLITRVMEYNKPEVLAKSSISMADCKKGPCGRPSCATKPSGKH